MFNSLPNAEPRDYNSSAVLAVYYILRRQPWKTMAIRTWDTMKRLLQMALLAASLGSLLPAVAHARTYDVLSTNVPFRFQVGDRTFKPGHYQFILAGPGIVAMRDSQKHFIASIVTRARETGGPVSENKLVFNTQKKHAQLTEIWIANKSQIMQVVGEEIVVRQTAPAPPVNAFQPGFGFLFERPSAPGLKH